MKVSGILLSKFLNVFITRMRNRSRERIDTERWKKSKLIVQKPSKNVNFCVVKRNNVAVVKATHTCRKEGKKEKKIVVSSHPIIKMMRIEWTKNENTMCLHRNERSASFLTSSMKKRIKENTKSWQKRLKEKSKQQYNKT